jgi:hypothetical protein
MVFFHEVATANGVPLEKESSSMIPRYAVLILFWKFVYPEIRQVDECPITIVGS